MELADTAAVKERSDHSPIISGDAVVLYLAGVTLVFHLLTASRYGIFRDELYYLACSEHLDWGYVDQPPLIAFIAWVARHVFGDSLLGLRLLPALAAAALVWVSGKITKEIGGGGFAQGLAALAVVVVPVYLILQHWLTMNAFEPLIWMGCAWCIVRAINRSEPVYWLAFGVLAGVGMENKYSMALFVFGTLVGLLLTPERRFLRSRWIWLGALVAILIFLPNLLWLVRHNFPFLELMRNVRRSGRDVVRGPLAFIGDQAAILNPVLFPLWVLGLWWFLFRRTGRSYRMLGWTYVVLLAMFIVLKGKNYYLTPAYPMLFAAGAVAFEEITRNRWLWSKTAYIGLIVIAGLVVAPLAAPILPVETYIRYQRLIGISPPKFENQRTGPLPQYFADEFGWEEMTRDVGRVFNGLPEDQRRVTAIFANDYGEAGAIDFFGPKYGLPKAISNHQNYWYWGTHGYTGESVIVLGSNGKGDREHFATVEAMGQVSPVYSRLDEHFDIFLCRGLKWPFQELWPQIKKWN